MTTGAPSFRPPLPAGVKIPSDKVLAILLARPPVTVLAHTPLFRAVWNVGNIWPHSVTKTYRFGPPAESFDSGGTPPFHWMYAADNAMTAVLEARFTRVSMEDPNLFYIEPDAAKIALVAALNIGRDLQLLDLTGNTGALTSLYDVISSPDYQACNWLGLRLHDMGITAEGPLDGILYPSRIRRVATAIAISSTRIADLESQSTDSVVNFKDTAEYQALMADKLRTKAPPPTT